MQPALFSFFFFNDTATTEIYTLSLHDALPISLQKQPLGKTLAGPALPNGRASDTFSEFAPLFLASALACRSEEHTSELQSQSNLVCRLLLEKKKRVCQIIHDIMVLQNTRGAPL